MGRWVEWWTDNAWFTAWVPDKDDPLVEPLDVSDWADLGYTTDDGTPS